MTIDWTKISSAKDKAEAEAIRCTSQIKFDCESRIKSVLDDNTVKNLISARLRNRMTPDQEAAFDAVDDWKIAMIKESRRAIETGESPSWPALPEGVAELLADF